MLGLVILVSAQLLAAFQHNGVVVQYVDELRAEGVGVHAAYTVGRRRAYGVGLLVVFPC